MATSCLISASSTMRWRSRSTRKSLPGCSRPLRTISDSGDGQRAGLGGEHDLAVAGLDPAARAQAVAVQRRPDQVAVGEGDDGGPVPRLHEARVVLVEAAHLGAHEVLAALVGLGDHHHQRVRERAPRELQQLDHVVEGGRVRVARLDDRRELLEVVAEQLRLQRGLARAHPVAVAHERVDLAVVGDEPVRVRERPARERVGGEARVDERQRRRRRSSRRSAKNGASWCAMSMPL